MYVTIDDLYASHPFFPIESKVILSFLIFAYYGTFWKRSQDLDELETVIDDEEELFDHKMYVKPFASSFA